MLLFTLLFLIRRIEQSAACPDELPPFLQLFRNLEGGCVRRAKSAGNQTVVTLTLEWHLINYQQPTASPLWDALSCRSCDSFFYLFCLLLTVFPLYSFTCRRASRLWVFKSFATWGDTCLFRLWWKIVSRCLLKMNFKRCLNEKCGWQAVAGKHGRCILHKGSAREMGKIPQTNECLGNTQCYSTFCDRSLTDWGHFWKVPHCWSTLPCTDQWAHTSFILIYLKRITFCVMSLMFYQQSFLFFK